jgi:CheY-like chemotaxis protein
MKSVRMLIVEDDKDLLSKLKAAYRSAFELLEFDSVTIEQAETAEEARNLARQAMKNPYDLVSLDVNLGDANATGLDVLSSLKRFQSAWMVALLTGVETDETLAATMGGEKADNLRKRLRRDAYSRFDAERLIVIEKPSPTLPLEEASSLLENRIGQIALIFKEIDRLRYIFRPIKVVSLERVTAPKGKKIERKFIETESTQWQIRFNCGDIRTLPDRTGFLTLHHILSMDCHESLTADQAMMIEPKMEKDNNQKSAGGDPVAEYFNAQGVDWLSLSQAEQDNLIRAALSLRFKKYVELRGYQDENDISPEEEDELQAILLELGPLVDAAESAYQRMSEPNAPVEHEINHGEIAQNDLHAAGGNFNQEAGRRGYDSPNAKLFRKRMERTRDSLRENGFSELADHLRDYLMSTGANWSYNGEIEWTT